MLRLTGDMEIHTCPTCRGRGRVPCPRTLGVRTLNGGMPVDVPSWGKPIPCPECKGRKVVAGPSVDSDGSSALRLSLTE